MYPGGSAHAQAGVGALSDDQSMRAARARLLSDRRHGRTRPARYHAVRSVDVVDRTAALEFADRLGLVAQRTVVLAPVFIALSLVLPWFEAAVADFELSIAIGSVDALRGLGFVCLAISAAAALWLRQRRSIPAALLAGFVGLLASFVVVVGRSLADVADAAATAPRLLGVDASAGVGLGANAQAIGGLMLLTASALVLMERMIMWCCYRPPLAKNRVIVDLVYERAHPF